MDPQSLNPCCSRVNCKFYLHSTLPPILQYLYPFFVWQETPWALWYVTCLIPMGQLTLTVLDNRVASVVLDWLGWDTPSLISRVYYTVRDPYSWEYSGLHWTSMFSSLKWNTLNSLVLQCLGLLAFTAKGLDSITGRGTKILQATWLGQIKQSKMKWNWTLCSFLLLESVHNKQSIRCDKGINSVNADWIILQKMHAGTSLVIQWLRLSLAMQRARVRSLVRDLRYHIPQCQKTKG